MSYENEKIYYEYKMSLARTYGDLQHEAIMNNEVQKQEYGLFALLKPKICKDGDQWCVLYGENLQDGVAGFGDTPYLAILNFNKAFNQPIKDKPVDNVHPAFKDILNSINPNP